MSERRKFDKQFLLEEVIYNPPLHEEITHVSRWLIHFFAVFEHEGKHWGVEYSRGATEMQDEQPFEYDDEEIECREVEQVMKPVWVYKES